MKKCPVCDADIGQDISTCSVCDTDLTIVDEMSRAPDIFGACAVNALKEEEYSEAIRYSGLSLELDPNNPKMLRCLALAHEAANHTRDALHAWRSILTLVPDDHEAGSRIKDLEKLLGAEGKTAQRSGSGTHTRPLKFAALAVLMALFGWYGRGALGPERKNISSAGENRPSIVEKNGSPQTMTADVRTDGGGTSVLSIGGNDPVSRPAEGKVESPLGSQAAQKDSGPSLQVIEKVSAEIPAEVRFQFKDGGIFLYGWIDYPWSKKRLEDLARSWGFRFVDMTLVAVKSPGAFQYQVQKGDTLSGIAKRFLGKQTSWDLLYRVNRDTLKDPNTLEAGQHLVVFTIEPE